MYEPNKKSVSRHQAPQWFHDAKFGIFIHWSLSSVPAYAPVDRGSIWEIVAKHGWAEHYKYNPYAEWYLNTMKIEGSPTREYHLKNYGPALPYEKFAHSFNQTLNRWNPEEWAGIFKEAGARYVVLVTKHHDGFLLWPSECSSPYRNSFHARRDVVGELTRAVKARGMKMGLYYSGGLDWSFNEAPIHDFKSSLRNGPACKEYDEYVDRHFRELIDKYKPSLLWNDISYPAGADLFGTLAYFYNRTPDGVINDRWLQLPASLRKIMTAWPIVEILDRLSVRVIARKGLNFRPPPFADYSTPEYTTVPDIAKHKWECVRGIGHSFGFNQMERSEHYLKPDQAVRLLIDVVSKNGNLLLNMGPCADGSFNQEQLECVRGVGRWLKVNGDAIYGTRPWHKAEGETEEGMVLRFTAKDDILYAIILGTAGKPGITIRNLLAKPGTRVRVLGNEAELEWLQSGNNFKIKIPAGLAQEPAYALKISPQPTLGDERTRK